MADMGLVGMGGAAGAADSIAQLFDQRLKAAQLGQQDALTRLKIQEVADARAETIKQREDVATERAQHQKEVEQDKADQRARMGYPLIPLNSPVSDQTRQTMTQAGIPPEAFQPTPDAVSADLQPPASIANDAPAETTVPGTIANSPSPAMRTFQRVPSPAEAETQRKQQAIQQLQGLYPIGSRERALIDYESATGKNAPAGLEPTAKPGEVRDSEQGLIRVAPDGTVTPIRDASGKQVRGFHEPPIAVIQGANGPELVDKGKGVATPVTEKGTGAVVGPAPSAQEKNRVAMATSVGAQFPTVMDELKQAQEQGLLGPGLGRVAEFLSRPVGSTGNPEHDQLLGALHLDLTALASGFAALHGRGGAGASQAAEIKKQFDASHMSYDELQGALTAMNRWTTGYAKGTQSNTGTKLSAEELIKKYGGGR